MNNLKESFTIMKKVCTVCCSKKPQNKPITNLDSFVIYGKISDVQTLVWCFPLTNALSVSKKLISQPKKKKKGHLESNDGNM